MGATEARRARAAVVAVAGAWAAQGLSGGGVTVELIQHRGASAPLPRPLGLFKVGFHVEDIEVAHRWFRDLGADVDAAPFTDDALSVRSFVVRDPEGIASSSSDPAAGRARPQGTRATASISIWKP